MLSLIKKIFAVIFIVVGVVCLPKAFTPSVPETIGGLIGICLFSGIPAYFLLREKQDEDNEN